VKVIAFCFGRPPTYGLYATTTVSGSNEFDLSQFSWPELVRSTYT
jgi:hypothetical protein